MIKSEPVFKFVHSSLDQITKIKCRIRFMKFDNYVTLPRSSAAWGEPCILPSTSLQIKSYWLQLSVWHHLKVIDNHLIRCLPSCLVYVCINFFSPFYSLPLSVLVQTICVWGLMNFTMSSPRNISRTSQLVWKHQSSLCTWIAPYILRIIFCFYCLILSWSSWSMISFDFELFLQLHH